MLSLSFTPGWKCMCNQPLRYSTLLSNSYTVFLYKCQRSILEPHFFVKETSTSMFFWLLQNLRCIGSSLIEKQQHVLECLDVYWDNWWFNCESWLILTYFKYILYNYAKHTQPPGYSLSMDRTISDISNQVAKGLTLKMPM